MILSTLIFFISSLSILVSVSFYTLFERNLLSSSHLRLGPSLVGILGLLQPFADALNLFSNELIWLKTSNYLVYLLCPLASISWCILLVSVVSSELGVVSWSFFPLALLLIITLGLLPVLLSGWSSNSPWALLGSIRSVAQAVSYEVSLAFLMVLWLYTTLTASTPGLLCYTVPPLLSYLPVLVGWLFTILAESNRTPFDFAEAESELVSGFNVEYGGGWFACIFISEYTSIIIFSLLTAVLSLGSGISSGWTWLIVAVMLYFYVWARCSFPRTRYDKLMSLSWFLILPVVLLLLYLCLLS